MRGIFTQPSQQDKRIDFSTMKKIVRDETYLQNGEFQKDLGDKMDMTMESLRRIIREVLIERKASKGKKTSSKDGAIQKKKYSGKEYASSAGSVASIKKHGNSVEKAVKSGDFDWSDNPYAAAQAAHIVATGKPSVAKGSKRGKMSEGASTVCEECGAMYEGASCDECGY